MMLTVNLSLVERNLVDQKLESDYAAFAWEAWPSAYWCRSEPVKKHGLGAACALAIGDTAR